MPELPDIVVYVESLQRFIAGRTLREIVIRSPALLRTFDPPIECVHAQPIREVHRIGKRIVWQLGDDLHLVFHLMVGGRFHWRKIGTRPRGKNDLAAFVFDHGALLLTEASQKKRASLHIVRGHEALSDFDRGGIDVLQATESEFAAALRSENHTLKRSLTDPRLFDGIGNAYSDEILHAARLSPLQWSQRTTDAQVHDLYEATQRILRDWTDRLRSQTGDRFPEKVTAFHPDMAVHGKFDQPCPACGTAIQRIRYADNETNYCPRCQTGGKVYADRSLSRLLKDDWPSTLDELEEFQTRRGRA